MSTHAGAAPLLRVTEVESWENEGGPPVQTREKPDERLDWVSFLARFYPDARRHDYESLAAYLEYRKDLEHAAQSFPARESR